MRWRGRWVSAAAGRLGLRWGGLMSLGGAGWLQLRAGGHWGVQEKRCWFVVLGWWLWCTGVLRLVGAEDHELRATYVRTATWGSLGVWGGYPGDPSSLAQPLVRCLWSLIRAASQSAGL